MTYYGEPYFGSPPEHWDRGDKYQFYKHKAELVAIAGNYEGKLPLEETLDPRARTLAAFSLVQEGILALSTEGPAALELTEAGVRRYIGFKALNWG